MLSFPKTISKLALIATLLAVTVVLLGAYTRLKDAGLGCPDWPGCYGQLSVPQSQQAIQKAQQHFPDQKIIPHKAWPEMVHRYFAGTLGLLILGLWIFSLKHRKSAGLKFIILSTMLMGLVIFQALLGMWTVTLLLLPLVVMGHLLGGMLIASILWWTYLSSRNTQLDISKQQIPKFTKYFSILSCIALMIQIFLGGWTSANYASIICPTFPLCHGKLFPIMDFKSAFNLFHPLGPNYEGGVLDTTARVTIQMSHRYGAFITAILVTFLSFLLIKIKNSLILRTLGWVLLSVLMLQLTLGIANIDTKLALPVAVAHNGVALALLITLITIIYQLFSGADSDNSRNDMAGLSRAL